MMADAEDGDDDYKFDLGFTSDLTVSPLLNMVQWLFAEV